MQVGGPSAWPMGGCEMTNGNSTIRAPRSRSAPRVVSPRNKVNVALPFSRIAAEDPMKMKVGDWIGLAGLVISVIGFSIATRQLIRIAHASQANSRPADP